MGGGHLALTHCGTYIQPLCVLVEVIYLSTAVLLLQLNFHLLERLPLSVNVRKSKPSHLVYCVALPPSLVA